MDCKADSSGNLTFTVVKPETISGITGTLSGDGGNLTFDDTALHFELMAENQLSPVSAPWILIKTLRNGYITSNHCSYPCRRFSPHRDCKYQVSG